MCVKCSKDRFTVDKSGKCFIFMNNQERHSVLNETFLCQPFRKFSKASKCSGEVKKTNRPSTAKSDG